jgi:hypothetical protein
MNNNDFEVCIWAVSSLPYASELYLFCRMHQSWIFFAVCIRAPYVSELNLLCRMHQSCIFFAVCIRAESSLPYASELNLLCRMHQSCIFFAECIRAVSSLPYALELNLQVSHLMSFQISFLVKSFSAHCTLKWLVPRVYTQMHRQARRLCEVLPTDTTNFGLASLIF